MTETKKLPEARVATDDGSRSLPIRYEAHAVIHTAYENDGRASIYLSPHNLHVGVRFPSPNNETNCLIRLAALKRAADALNDLGAMVGQQFSGMDLLLFPEPLKE